MILRKSIIIVIISDSHSAVVTENSLKFYAHLGRSITVNSIEKIIVINIVNVSVSVSIIETSVKFIAIVNISVSVIIIETPLHAF